MMHLKLIIFLYGFTTFVTLGQNVETKNFPNSYFGIYTGDLIINTNKGVQNYPMEFHMQPTDSLGVYDYTIVYGKGEQQQVRDYTLKEKDVEKGIYTLDENNGVLLESRVIENKIYFLFEVANSLLTTFITFNDKDLIFEIIATNTTQKMVSGGQDEETPEVFSYPINVVQKAVLIKQ